jgi:hypothetical protein
VGREGAGGRAGGREDEGGVERGREGRGGGEREREEVCGGHGVCIATQRDFRNVSAVVAEHRAGGIVGAHACGRGVCVCDVWYEGEWCETHLHTQGRSLLLPSGSVSRCLLCVCGVWYEGERCETHLHTQGMPLLVGLFCSFMGLFVGLF